MARSLYSVEDGEVRLHFHPGQSDAWKSQTRFTAMIAGTQGGKTSFGPWWLHREIVRCGPGDYLAVTSTYDLFKLKFLPALRDVFEHQLGIGRYWANGVMELSDPERGFLARRADDPMWARIILRSATARGGLESATANAALLDEAGQDDFTLEAWEAVLRRLSLKRGRVMITTTPYNMGWLKREFYDRWLAGDPEYLVVQFPSDMNPVFPRAELARAKRTMSDHAFQMYYLGQFCTPPGLIYDFSDVYNVVQPFSIPPDYPRYIGIDFGATNTAVVYGAENPATGEIFIYHTTLSGGKTTTEHCAEIRANCADVNLVGAWGGAPSESQQRLDWTAAGVNVQEPGIVDVEAGISRVYAGFKTRRLKVFGDQRGLLDEIGSYRRKVVHGQVTEIILSKRQYHRLDALRYLVAGLSQYGVSYGRGLWD